MSFTADQTGIALEWLIANRHLWSEAYAVRIEPVAFPVNPATGRITHWCLMLITIQGVNLHIPDGVVTGIDSDTGYREGLLAVSDELAIAWCDTADRAEEASS